MLAPRRLPGLRVDIAARPPVEALPRMDIAVFVGFASTGPLHVPVAIESAAQYDDVFGQDAPLAWDAERGERVFALLGAAVRAFFSNGGRRCWVIRVARTAQGEALRSGPALSPQPAVAVAGRFAIPGVLQVEPLAGEVSAAIAAARCEGSWSDGLRVSSAVAKLSIGVGALAPVASPGDERYRFGTLRRLRPGDVLEFGDPESVSAYAVVDAVAAAQSDADGPYVVDVTVCAAFERLGAGSSPPFASSPAMAAVPGFDPAPATLGPAPDATGATLRLTFDRPMPPTLAPGAWARWSGGGESVWLRMDSLALSLAPDSSPPAADPSWIDASADGPAWRELAPGLPMPLATITRANVLTLELLVADEGGAASRLSGVGLAPQHPAAWWQQKTDAEHYATGDEPNTDPSELAVPAAGPRFPLAAEAGAALAWVPLGVDPLFGARAGPLPASATALERDGLARFDPEVFLDPELASSSVQTLIDHADGIRFLRETPRELLGIHAALSIGRGGMFNEASLLMIPDAVHLGWEKRKAPEVDPPEPGGSAPPPHWSHHRGACAQPAAQPAAPTPEGCAADWSELCCPVARSGPAVPIAPFEPDFGVFLDCATRVLAAPQLFGPAAPLAPGGYRLAWTDSEHGATYVLLEAQRADFGDAREAYRGGDLEHTVDAQREGVYYYQVSAEIDGDRSAGSNAVAVSVLADDWVLAPAAEFAGAGEAGLLELHRAALRLCAASGELFAPFALPRHYRAPEAVRYAERLRQVYAAAGAGALSAGEARALSYGALYHPWLASGAAGALQAVPPDGFAAGVLAARASDRGAWIAPANEDLKDAVALTPTIAPADWQALQDAQINVVRDDPRGFLALSADTLAGEDDVDLRPINVRRLLILLRRLALRRGMSYVFEPNGPQLRRAVQRSFTTLLGDLFRRGAFAGETAAESFRVVTDDTINTPRDADAGRLIVELRVAPSVPMRFLSVLLAQSGERLTVAEEL